MQGALDTRRFPSRGIELQVVHDLDTANARQIDLIAGFILPAPGGAARR
jgi:hypothetical protein